MSKFCGVGECAVALCLILAFCPWTTAAAVDRGVVLHPNYAAANTSRWVCRRCPIDLQRHETTVSAGTVVADSAHPRRGRDSGIVSQGPYLDLGIKHSSQHTNGRRLYVVGERLGLDSRYIELGLQRAGRLAGKLSWLETPRRRGADFLTPFVLDTATADASNALVLPAAWNRSFQTGDFTNFVESSDFLNVGSQRQQGALEASVQLAKRWRAHAKYGIETRHGRDTTSADLLFRATALPVPIDQETRSLSTNLSYSSRAAQLELGVARQHFVNRVRSLTWQNPYLGQPDQLRLSGAPGNRVTSLSATGRLMLGTDSLLTGGIGWSRAQHNERLLHYTTNQSLDSNTLPVDRFKGEVANLTARLGFTSRLRPNLRLTLKSLVRKRNNQSPEVDLVPVVGDLFVSTGLPNRNYDFSSSKSSAQLKYRIRSWLKIASGVEVATSRRSQLEIRSNRQNRLWLGLDVSGHVWGHGKWLSGLSSRIRVERLDRSASRFVLTGGNNPLTRRFYQAEREDLVWSASIDYQLSSMPISLGAEADYARRRYPDSVLGLQVARDSSWGANMTIRGDKNAKLLLAVQRQDQRSLSAGSRSFSMPDFSYITDDAVTTFRAEFDVQALASERASLRIRFLRSDGVGAYATRDLVSADAGRFPELATVHQTVEAQVRYQWRPQVVWIGRYAWNKYRSEDWALTGLAPQTLGSVLSFGQKAPNYDSSLVSIGMQVRW